VNPPRAAHASISLVAAVTAGGVIGRDGGIPWRLPADLAHFRTLTMGHVLILGRKTFDSLGRALPGRRMIVLSRDPAFRAAGCEIAGSLENALEGAGGGEVFVIGGASVYAQALPLASRMYLTRIDAAFAGDAFFPEFDTGEWRLLESRPGVVDPDNRLPHEFQVWERRQQ
jgi:dihydrofolate reductase